MIFIVRGWKAPEPDYRCRACGKRHTMYEPCDYRPNSEEVA